MSADITKISSYELREDRATSLMDINFCEKMLGATRNGLDFQERARVNRQIVAKIDAELARRGEPPA